MPEAAALVTGLILERPLCLDCLSTKATLSPTAVERTLTTIDIIMAVTRRNARCRACEETKETVSLRRPDAPNRDRPEVTRL